jgi:hypothetical protein
MMGCKSIDSLGNTEGTEELIAFSSTSFNRRNPDEADVASEAYEAVWARRD